MVVFIRARPGGRRTKVPKVNDDLETVVGRPGVECLQCKVINPPGSNRCHKCSTPLVDASVTTTGGVVSGWSLPAPAPEAVASSLASLRPGTLLGGRYEILQLLGEGGMGAVYKAQDKDLDRLVAVKVIRPELAGRPEILQRFKQELILARQVTHKNVIRIFDLGQADGIKFITMEYVEGQDLKHILRDKGRLSPEEVAPIMQQVCRALEAAHSEGVIHRDLKPQNIMVDERGKILVMDFGIARSMEVAGMTQTGALMGTPEYMSPEQARGEKVDPRSDLFTVGVIFWELLAGKSPYQSDTPLGSLLKRLQERAKPLVEVAPEIPQPLSDVVNKCLETDPALRYQSATEILQDLDALHGPGTPTLHAATSPAIAPDAVTLAGVSVSGATAAPATPHPKSVKRHWMWAAVCTGAVLMAATGLFLYRGRTIFKPSPKYVAVLPFRPLGDQESLKYEAEGMVEALSAKLFQLNNVRLASPAAVEKIDVKDPLEKIARSLGVTLVVQGTVQGAGDRIKVVISLEDVAAHRRLWNEEFSGLRQDLITLQDQIYTKLVSALDLRLSNEELARGASRPTEDIGAYELYLKGRNVMRGVRDVKNGKRALEFYDRAVKKDPSFALAYAGASDACLSLYELTKDGSWSEKALGAANQGQRLNDSSPEVHFSLGSVYMGIGRTAEAIAELKRALELAPSSDEGYRRLGSAYAAAGRRDEALQTYQKAIEINPYNWLNHNQLGAAHLRFGQNDKAMEAFRRVTEIEPDRASGYSNIGVVFYRQGKWKECIPAFEKATELQPSFRGYSNLGTAYFYLGRYAEAAKMFEKAVKMSPNEQLAVGNLADAYRWLGQRDQALATYDRAIALALKALQVNPRDSSTLGSLALYYAKKDDANRGAEFIRRARSVDPNDNNLLYKEAVIHSLASRSAEALQSLREAFQKGYPPEEAKSDPELRKIWVTPEFERLVKEFSRTAN